MLKYIKFQVVEKDLELNFPNQKKMNILIQFFCVSILLLSIIRDRLCQCIQRCWGTYDKIGINWLKFESLLIIIYSIELNSFIENDNGLDVIEILNDILIYFNFDKWKINW